MWWRELEMTKILIFHPDMNLNVCHNISVKSKNINLMMSREENATSVGNIVCGPSTSAQKIQDNPSNSCWDIYVWTNIEYLEPHRVEKTENDLINQLESCSKINARLWHVSPCSSGPGADDESFGSESKPQRPVWVLQHHPPSAAGSRRRHS